MHDQNVPDITWTIVHNLGYHPNVTAFDSAGTEWEGEIEHVDNNTLLIHWPSAFGGVAYLS